MTPARITLKQIWQHSNFIEIYTLLVLPTIPVWTHYELFPGDDRLSRVMDWGFGSVMVVATVIYAVQIARSAASKVAE
jgi:hypothetical protein